MSAIFEIAAFAAFGFIAVTGALGMTTTMSMFRSGIFLMASFIGVAGLFIVLSADLIGLLQVMMYIGGFLVMILFMVLVMHDPGGAMMAGMDMAPVERWFSGGLVPRRPETEAQGGHGHGRTRQGGPGGPGDEGRAMAHGSGEDGSEGHDIGFDEHGQRGGAVAAMPRRADDGQGGAAAHRHEDPSHGHEHGEGHDHGHGTMDMSMTTQVRPFAAWLAIGAGSVLVAMLVLRPAWPVSDAVPDPDSARRVGHLLMEKYMVAFEGAGFLILIGIFGAVLLARPSAHSDDASRAARVAVEAIPDPIEDDGLVASAREEPTGEQPRPADLQQHGQHHP